MLSSNVNRSLHLSREHYRPVITGGAAHVLGDADHLRLVSIAIGSLRDECEPCFSDTLDAIALSADAMAVTHRIESMMGGGAPVPHGSDGADQVVARMRHVPFPMRRQMAEVSIRQLKETLDGAEPPEAII